jgi:hypothetical protein
MASPLRGRTASTSPAKGGVLESAPGAGQWQNPNSSGTEANEIRFGSFSLGDVFELEM